MINMRVSESFEHEYKYSRKPNRVHTPHASSSGALNGVICQNKYNATLRAYALDESKRGTYKTLHK
jgi:hypothetical protein